MSQSATVNSAAAQVGIGQRQCARKKDKLHYAHVIPGIRVHYVQVDGNSVEMCQFTKERRGNTYDEGPASFALRRQTWIRSKGCWGVGIESSVLACETSTAVRLSSENPNRSFGSHLDHGVCSMTCSVVPYGAGVKLRGGTF